MAARKRKKIRKPGWYIIAAVVALALLIGFGRSGSHLLRLWRLFSIRQEENAELRRSLDYRDSLREEVTRLESDTTYIEEIAREQYGMRKEGEEVFIIDPDSMETDGNER